MFGRTRNSILACLCYFAAALFSFLPDCIAFSDDSAETGLADSPKKQQISDTTLWWTPWYAGGEKSEVNVQFYLGGRFAGADEKGFKNVIEKIKRLPAGTSVVWGPNGEKMLSSGGDDVVARDYFPELWQEFQSVAKKQGIVLSSLGYRSYAMSADAPPPLPRYVYLEPKSPKQKKEVFLEWKSPDAKDRPSYEYWSGRHWPVYFLDGQESGRGPEGFQSTIKEIAKLPQGTQLRFLPGEPPGLSWIDEDFRELAASKGLKFALELRKDQWPKNHSAPACRIEWRNFQTQSTPHSQIVYLLDGKLAGIGDAGFDTVLARLRELPAGSLVEYPKFILHGQVRGYEELKDFEAKNVVPFAKRRNEFDDIVQESQLKIEREQILYWPKPIYHDHVDGSTETCWFLESLLSFAMIVRDGAKPNEAAGVITWTQPRKDGERPSAEATYFFNGKKTGVGMQGFLAVLKQIESLPDGSVIRIDPVCLRTHGPFTEAIIMKNQRHFETTGEEPFRGLIDLLKDSAQRKKLKVEVIPDEGRPDSHPGG